MKFITLAASMLLLVFAAAPVRAGSEIAVAIRYLKAEGVSHSQLFLFREDGTLLRQLTHFKSGQVYNPVFSPDGATIVFKLVTGEIPYTAFAYSDTYPIVFKLVKGKGVEYWSVEPKGENLRKLDSAPDWYMAAKDSPYFTNSEPIPAGVKVLGGQVDDSEGKYTTPDGKQELILQSPADDPSGDDDMPGHGSHFLLRDLKTKKSVEMGGLKGFLGLYELLYINGKIDDVFLTDQPLRLAFFGIHLGSSDGDTVFALDLNSPRLVRLSMNWAMPVPLPGEGAFLVRAEARYQPIPGSEKTANGSYLEFLGSDLKKVRYGRSNTATLCYGASMYRPGKKPGTITITGPNSDE
jgi:hypothetical protein